MEVKQAYAALDRMIEVRGQLAQFRAGGLAIIPKKVVAALRYGLHALWAVPLVLILRLVARRADVRIGKVYGGRIGHFVMDPAIYLADHDPAFRRRRILTFLWFSESCNAQWSRMLRRTLFAGKWVFYPIVFDRIIPGSRLAGLPATNGSRDIRGRVQRSSLRFEFDRQEVAFAKHWLAKRGWQEGEPFVCLLVRDSAYLTQHPMHAAESWAYHDYRDSDIDSYANAVHALLARGYWVIRMGTVMNRPLSVDHPRCIDYPFVRDQDDVVDVWLSANAAFYISTGAGLDAVAFAFGKPVLYVNYAPLAHIWSFAHNTCAPKRCRWQSNGKLLTAREQLDHSYLRKSDYDSAGIILENLNAAEITDAVVEVEQRVTGTWCDSREDIERQTRFWQLLAGWSKFAEIHGYKHPEARLGSAWLRAMGDEFLSDADQPASSIGPSLRQ